MISLQLDDLIGRSRDELRLLREQYRRETSTLLFGTPCDDETEAADVLALFHAAAAVLGRIDRALLLKRKAGAR
jgi:hypothetical protein